MQTAYEPRAIQALVEAATSLISQYNQLGAENAQLARIIRQREQENEQLRREIQYHHQRCQQSIESVSPFPSDSILLGTEDNHAQMNHLRAQCAQLQQQNQSLLQRWQPGPQYGLPTTTYADLRRRAASQAPSRRARDMGSHVGGNNGEMAGARLEQLLMQQSRGRSTTRRPMQEGPDVETNAMMGEVGHAQVDPPEANPAGEEESNFDPAAPENNQGEKRKRDETSEG